MILLSKFKKNLNSNKNTFRYLCICYREKPNFPERFRKESEYVEMPS